MEHEEQMRRLYSAFNARDAEAVLAEMTDDVDWPNGWEGGRLSGRDAVRAYWLRQWAEIDGTVEPTGFELRPDGSLAVSVHQVVRNLDGELLSEQDLHHVYAFRDGLVAAMDDRGVAAPSAAGAGSVAAARPLDQLDPVAVGVADESDQ